MLLGSIWESATSLSMNYRNNCSENSSHLEKKRSWQSSVLIKLAKKRVFTGAGNFVEVFKAGVLQCDHLSPYVIVCVSM